MLIVGIVIAMCVFLYARRRIVTVPDHRAQVTRLGRAYFRTLRPGMSVLLPGERTFVALDTSARSFVTPPCQVRIESAEGVVYAPRATAEVIYHLVPTRAHLAVLASDRWEEDVRAAASRALDDALADWAIQLLDEEEPPAEGYLARTTLVRLRDATRPCGVHIDTVKVQQIRMQPESEVIPAEWARVARPPLAASVPAIGERMEFQALATPPYAPAPRQALTPSTSLEAPPLPEDLAPEALSDAYDEVRSGHITDPATIRRIARAFQAVAADPSLNERFPYDAAAAARILFDLAASMDGQATPG
jgi:hypothetical protein